MAHDAARIREHVVTRLIEESKPGIGTPTSRVRALELLGTLDIVDAFGNMNSQAEEPLSGEELKDELLRKLGQIMEKGALLKRDTH